ncbi:MAG: DUF1844 domain-containing protein [Deltaproteobacteria bacterium]|nr:DUF1844 domain-containing protein [Deltaproteobacteria bacterium]
MSETEDKGYTVKDRRFHQLSEEEKAKARETGSAQEQAFQEAAQKAASGTAPGPGITFSSLIFSLSSTAFMQLGALPDPNTGKTEKNLPLAKQTIDLLGVLREKTRNNLEQDEENLFEHLLYDLHMAYIKEVG